MIKLHPNTLTSLDSRRKTVCEQSCISESTDEILKCAYDTLSHEATGEDLWIAVKQCNSHYRSYDNDNIMNAVHLDNNHTM